MPSREKRAKKSIRSLELQILKHEEKMAKSGFPELRSYYEKEITQLKRELHKKKKILVRS